MTQDVLYTTVIPFDSTGVVRVGAHTVSTEPWLGRIYSVELRTGLDPLAGAVLWRFDADDYPGTGTVYTDPRGRTWTLTSASAITPAAVTGTDVQQTALRFPTTATFDTEELVGTGIFYARPLDYGTVEITWGITLDLAKWGEIAVVRSAFGMPLTVNDGQTLFRATQAKLFPQGYTEKKNADGKQPVEARKIYDPRSMPGVGTQVVLPNGRWYYYGLFFRSGTKWHRYMVTQTLLPRNHHHAEHLFDNLPPYYQWTDDNMRGGRGDGDLRRFLKLIGYDLDLTRQYVESWLDLYHTDFTPIPLLRRLGANFGVEYEAGIGDIRYRGLISKIGPLYRSRGTSRSLKEMVVSVTKCSTDLTPSGNIMLLPDDSDFFEGTGNWAGIHPDTPLGGFTPAVAPVLTPDKIRLEHGVHVVKPPANSGRGVMRMWTSKADATANVLLTCGDGIAQDWEINVPFDRTDDEFQGIRAIYPRFSGIPVTPKEIYSFSIQVRPELAPVQMRTMILWFSVDGDSQDLVAYATPGPGPINSSTAWTSPPAAQGIAPANAAYAVPAVYFSSRLAGSDPDYSPYLYLCAAQFARIGTSATVSASSPDRYLTLGTPEKIGPATEEPPFEGYLIGDPTP